MQVKDVMTESVTTTTPDTPLADAAKVLAAERISGMPVVAEDGEVVGVISEADVLIKERWTPEPARGLLARRLRRRVHSDKRGARTVGEAMSSPAITIPRFASIATAAGHMLDHKVNRLPVLHRGRLAGIVTRADLVRAFARSDAEIEADAREQVDYQQAVVNDSSKVGVSVEQGVAVLTGAVQRRSEADILPRLVRHVPGVVDVRSDLTWFHDA